MHACVHARSEKFIDWLAINFLLMEHFCCGVKGPSTPTLVGATYRVKAASYNNNNNDRLTAFDPGQPG